MNKKFEYLRYPAELYKIKPKIDEAIGVNSQGRQIRKLFHHVEYTTQEKMKIQQFRRYAIEQNKIIDCNDFQVLRYLYSTNFDKKEALEKLDVFEQWMHDPAIQTMSHKAAWILSEGAIYTFGRDKLNRPVVYLDLTKIKLDRYEIIDYYCAFNAVLNLVVSTCFVPGVIENYLFVIDMGGKNFTSLPFEALGSIIKKMSIVYSMFLGTMLIINTQNFIKFSFNAFKIFIHEDTRKKILMLNTDQIGKMQQYVDKSQLHKKHHGQNHDPFEYWPPQIPGQKKMKFYDEESVYYSIDQNESLFEQTFSQNANQRKSSCCYEQCSQGQSCQIF